MGRQFCESPFWDADLTWNTDSPDFTPCFENTVLVIVPCVLLLIISPFYLVYIFKCPLKRADPLPLTRLGSLRTIFSLALIFFAMMNFFRTVSEEVSGLQPEISLYVGPLIQAATFVWTTVLMHLERRAGVINSAPLFMFWVFNATLGVAQLYTYAQSPDTNDTYRVVVYSFYYAVTIIQLVLSCLIDVLPLRLATDTKISPEARASFLSYLTFHWVTGLCWLGFRKTLTQDDLHKMHPRDECATVTPLLEKHWSAELEKRKQFRSVILDAPVAPASEQAHLLSNQKGGQNYDATANTVSVSISGQQYEPSLFWALVKSYGPRIFVSHLGRLIYDLCNFSGPIALQWLITYTQNTNEPYWHGYVYAMVIFGTGILGSIAFNQFFHLTMTAATHLKASMLSIIYKKALTMSNKARREATVGEVVNLMSVDTERILNVFPYTWVIWSAPLQVTLALVMLWAQVGISALAGLVVLVLLIPINIVVSAYIRRQQVKQMVFKDKRLRLMTEILSGIKVLKLYAWENSFNDKIKACREEELVLLRKSAYLYGVSQFTWVCAPYLVLLATFTTYTLTSGQPLTPDKAFVALTLFNLLRVPLDILAMTISFLAQSAVSIKRIGKFLSSSDLDPTTVERLSASSSGTTAVQVTNGKFSWSTEDQPTLTDVNLKIGRGKLVAVVGPVGCGKSSLLSALLGDLERVNGNVKLFGTTAYVSQQAWIQNATIRDNILFGSLHDSSRYKEIIDSCALASDLQILEGGDGTEIGEKGINLSGGQKQRVSLARAVYSDRDIYFLDDPLSAVDAHVGKHIFENVIGPNGLLRRKTRVLVTHGLHWLPHCDEIIVMANGRISSVGTFKDLLSSDGAFSNFIREHLAEAGGTEALESELPQQAIELLRQISHESAHEQSMIQQTSPTAPKNVDRTRSVSGGPQSLTNSVLSVSSKSERRKLRKSSVKQTKTKLIEEEKQETGGVKWAVYWSFLKALNFGLLAIWLGFFLASQGIATFGNIWLTQWTADPLLMNVSLANTTEYKNTVNMYLGVYGAAAGGQALCILIHSIFYAMSSVRASRWLHQSMLHQVLRCAMSFFDTTPAGRVLNRFGRDTDTVDNVIPLTLRSWMTILMQIIMAVVIVIFGFPLFVIFAILMVIAYYFVQRFYIPTTRQLKRIESVTRSPIYNYLSETVTGASTIRAFNAQDRFLREVTARIDINNMSYLPSSSCNRWLAIRLQLLGNLTSFAVSLFAIAYRSTTNSSIVGLVLSSSLQITNALTWFTRTSSDLESNIVSVERIQEYMSLPIEVAWERKDTRPPKNWPPSGSIKFENYATRYRPGLSLVLNGISCEIKSGEKIGIVGRTGAGKSSLTLALFRLIEAAGGRILIDNVDISGLGLHQLRSRLTILPQDPVVFSGSIRNNLDPFTRFNDQALWESLDHSGLRQFVANTEKGLMHECGENGESLSVGQRQLLCLARALLNKTKVLVLDEATAAVDVETDEHIMETIRTEFVDCTVLIIAHRLNTVMDSDRVLVLDKGQIVEFDSPANLLANPSSVFAGMARSARALGNGTDDELDEEDQ